MTARAKDNLHFDDRIEKKKRVIQLSSFRVVFLKDIQNIFSTFQSNYGNIRER